MVKEENFNRDACLSDMVQIGMTKEQAELATQHFQKYLEKVASVQPKSGLKHNGKGGLKSERSIGSGGQPSGEAQARPQESGGPRETELPPPPLAIGDETSAELGDLNPAAPKKQKA